MYIYANKADLFNVLYLVRRQRSGDMQTKGKKENMRVEATIQQLLVLANMESYNTVLIEHDNIQLERLVLFHDLAANSLK